MNFLHRLLVQHLATLFVHCLQCLECFSSSLGSLSTLLQQFANSAFAILCLSTTLGVWLHLFLVAIDRRCIWWRSFSKHRIISLPSPHRVFDIGGENWEKQPVANVFALIPSFAPTNTVNSSVFVDTKGETPQTPACSVASHSGSGINVSRYVHAWDMMPAEGDGVAAVPGYPWPSFQEKKTSPFRHTPLHV